MNVDSTGHLYEDLQRELTHGLLQRLAPRYLLIHAGAVRMDDLALLIPGDHDSGKSSLSLGIGQIGSFYSDDVTPIDPATVTPRPFPRELVQRDASAAGGSGYRPSGASHALLSLRRRLS